jgi:DNA primase
VDFVFDKAAAGVDLRTARGKADLAAKLLPVIAEIKDPVRRGHYLALLAGRVGATSTELQHSLSQLKLPQPAARKVTGVTATLPAQSTAASRLYEDYLLILLLKHPELKSQDPSIKEEYFESVENREIFRACLVSDNPGNVRQQLDPTIWERFDRIMGMTVIKDDNLKERLVMCACRLEKEHLKITLKKIYEIQHDENDQGCAGEVLKYNEQKLAVAKRLGELDKLEAERHHGPRR